MAWIIESSNKELKFTIIAKDEKLKKEIKIGRIQKVEKTKENIYQKPYFDNLEITLIYLTKESLKGIYKDSKKNLPYEIVDGSWNTIYRQEAHKKYRKKEDIFNELEKAAIEEGLRKNINSSL